MTGQFPAHTPRGRIRPYVGRPPEIVDRKLIGRDSQICGGTRLRTGGFLYRCRKEWIAHALPMRCPCADHARMGRTELRQTARGRRCGQSGQESERAALWSVMPGPLACSPLWARPGRDCAAARPAADAGMAAARAGPQRPEPRAATTGDLANSASLQSRSAS